MRGLQLQTAITLVAEEKLSDGEIAEKLHVRLSALKEAMDEPYFAKRVAETRSAARLGYRPFQKPPSGIDSASC